MDLLTLIAGILFIFLFPFGETIRFTFGNATAVTLMDLGVGILFLFWIATSWYKLKNSFYILKPLELFTAACLLSLGVNSFFFPINEVFFASLYLFRFLLYASIYFIVSSQKNRLRERLPIILMISGILMLVLGYFQFFFYPMLRNLLYLGWDEHYYRMFGTFLDPNFFGTYLALFATYILGNILEKKNKEVFFLSILLLFVLGGIFLTFSRSAYIMTVCSLITMLLLKNKGKLIGALFAVLVCFALFYSLFITHPKEGMDLLRTTSTLARIGSTQHAWKIFTDHPIFGVGFNMYRYAQHAYGLLGTDNWLDSHAGAGTDNSLLFVLGTTGIIGFLAYLNLYWRIVKKSWSKRHITIFAPIIIASLSGLLVDSFFVNGLFFPFILVWMWSIIGMVA